MEGEVGVDVSSLRLELHQIRWELDRLVEGRLQTTLSLRAETEYSALTAREQWLLEQLPAAS